MKKKNLKLTIITLSITLLLISIGYAAYSTTLNIGANAKLNRNVWSIHYDKDTINILSGTDGEYTLVNPTVAPTVSSDLKSLSFETNLNINEETSFTIDVINDGTFSARVDNMELTVSSKTDSTTEYTTISKTGNNRWANDYLEFYVVWTDGEKNILDTEDIEASTTKNMTLKVKYKQPENSENLPPEDITFKFDVAITYVQASKTTTSDTKKSRVKEEIESASELINALDTYKDDDVILRLEDNIDLTSYTNIEIQNNTTIEFNGNNITTAPNSIQVADGGYLLLEDTTGTGGITTDRGCINVLSGGMLVVNSGTYTSTNYTRGSGIYVEDNGKVVINGGVFNASYYAIGTEGSPEITINGGELNSTSTNKNGSWAYSVKLTAGKFTMNGGKISGVQGGLALDGDVEGVINNGEIYVHESTSGANDGFYNMYVTGTSSLTIKNGTFTNAGTRSVIYTTSSNDINIEGGTYKASGTNLFTGTNIKITGGKFSHDVNTYITSGTLTHNETSNLYEL